MTDNQIGDIAAKYACQFCEAHSKDPNLLDPMDFIQAAIREALGMTQESADAADDAE